MKKTLREIIYRTSIATLLSFIPINKASAQETIKPINSIEDADKEFKRVENLSLERLNKLYLTWQDRDNGIGIRYDKKFSGKFHNFGIYSSISRGNYKSSITGNYAKNHIKASLGGIFYPEEEDNRIQGFFTFGVSHHSYGESSYDKLDIKNMNKFEPWSYEVGGGMRIMKYTWAIRFTPKKEKDLVSVDIRRDIKFKR